MTYTYKLSRRLSAIHDVARDLRPLILFLLVLLAAGCGDANVAGPATPPNPDRATPGWVSLVLVTPHSNDGAVQVSITGAPIDSLELTGLAGFATIADGAGHLLATGLLGNGPLGRMWIPDTRISTQYVARVEQAAARVTYQLQDISVGYGVQVVR